MVNSKQEKLVSYLRSQIEELQIKLNGLHLELEYGVKSMTDALSKKIYIDNKTEEIEVERLKLSLYKDVLLRTEV